MARCKFSSQTLPNQLRFYADGATPSTESGNKRGASSSGGDSDERAKRLRRIAEAKDGANYAGKSVESVDTSAYDFDPELSEAERLNILKYVENEEADGDVLDEPGLKKLVLVFEKRNLKNQEMRIKYPDNPEKFMESELELHGVIQELKAIA